MSFTEDGIASELFQSSISFIPAQAGLVAKAALHTCTKLESLMNETTSLFLHAAQ